ncbi:hypothetical protein HanIR_Chr16g0843611 [Helianthus annuus]|nr:hypothetical protein HanIR_Chr16g0843611 [Helianthus annuus]
MCLLVTFMLFMLSYHILAMFTSTLLVHDFIMFLLGMSVVAYLVHLIYNTFSCYVSSSY